jgi:predicted lipoprotein with Yx(FWY)xxD motif
MKARPLFCSIALVGVLAGTVVPAMAHHAVTDSDARIIALADGSTLYVFKDGKMAKANQYNRPVFLKEGETLEAKDGRKIVAVGNEVARLSSLFWRDHGN